MLEKEWQLAVLGTGDPELEAETRQLAVQHPDRVVAFLRYDDALARLLYASGDIFLMPSFYEPCGLSQMIAMRYGNLPLATATGGLKDTIIDYDSDLEKATGFLFTGQTSEAFLKRLDDALTVFKDQSVWQLMQHHAMTSDFSWANSAQSYLQVYRDLISDPTA